jgi:crotonobetainyl-CoA:carnitine CoA-transferase CaiB-like acyl-CoA transferase
MHAAFAVLSALEHREQTGAGQLIELAMIDLAAHLTIEQVLERSVYGHLMARQGNRLPGLAHQGVYACVETDQWIALRVATDDQWRALRSILGSPAWSLDPRLDTVGGRADRADLIDRELQAWFAQLGQKDALVALRSGGVDAEPVIHSYDVDLDEQMNARHFWEEVTHPLVGAMRFPGWPMRFSSRSGPWHQRPAPLLGQHTDEVLRELGMTGEELTALRADEIVGDRPATL